MKIIDILILVVNIFLMIYTSYMCFDTFVQNSVSMKKRIVIFVISSILLFLIQYFVPAGIWRTLLTFIVPLLLSYLFDLKWYMKILLSLISYALGGICEYITALLITTVFSLTSIQTSLEGSFKILGIILSKMLVLLILLFMKALKYKLPYSLSAKKCVVLFIIPISTMAISFFHIYWLGRHPQEYQAMSVPNTVSYIILIISNITVFHMVDHEYRDAEKDKQITTVTQLLETQSKQYEQMQQHNNEIQRIRHDQRHFITGLLTELNQGRLDNVQRSLEEEYALLSRPNEFEFKNGIITTAVQTKSNYAEQHGIAIDFQSSEIQKIQISAIDISIILCNALDNAIEATQKVSTDKKIIHVFAKVKNDTIIIIIKNPVVSAVDTDHLVSTKKDAELHGFGIASMRRLTKKYGGELIMQCDSHQFETTIILSNTVNT